MSDKISRAKKILRVLDKTYPYDGKCFLDYVEPWQLLFATILSAQCTDNMVNRVTAMLFAELPALEDYAACEDERLEALVRPTGFYRTKARNLKLSAQILLNEFGGELPSDLESLTSLPGVGRKTANVVRGHIFSIPSIVVDTHVARVSRRLGLAKAKEPVKIEFELMDALPESCWVRFNQQVIMHGRKTCSARKPKCVACELKDLCEERTGICIPRETS